MHDIEPYYNWRHDYIASEDERSPFFGRTYSEFEFTDSIYNYVIHPQWDNIGSPTLFIKILFADYDQGFCIIETIGEWNDTLHNDVMTLKRNIIDELIAAGLDKFIVIGENILNFHSSDDSYYEEWFEDVEDGWIAFINFRQHVINELIAANLDYYFVSGGQLENLNWRTYKPQSLFQLIEKLVTKRIGA